MIVSTILLTRDNIYVKNDGSLPIRPNWDKALLTSLCKDQEVSQVAYDMLPPSIRQVTKVTELEPTVGVTIREIDALSDLLIVSISNEPAVDGKRFRFDNFNLIVNTDNIQIWRRK